MTTLHDPLAIDTRRLILLSVVQMALGVICAVFSGIHLGAHKFGSAGFELTLSAINLWLGIKNYIEAKA